MVAFEIARRHRFAADMASLPRGVAVHVLPTGSEPRTPARRARPAQLPPRHRGPDRLGSARAYDACLRTGSSQDRG